MVYVDSSCCNNYHCVRSKYMFNFSSEANCFAGTIYVDAFRAKHAQESENR